MSSCYKIYPERKLLVEVMIGDVDFSQLIGIYLKEKEDENFHYVTRVLSDIRNANLVITADEAIEFINYLKNSGNSGNSDFRWAIITSNPHSTALSILISEDPFFINLIKVCSTLKGGLKFLDVNFSEEEFSDPDFILVK